MGISKAGEDQRGVLDHLLYVVKEIGRRVTTGL